MQARLIAYPPDAAALTRWIAPGERLRIGRASDCDLRLDHPSVSRHHAEMHHEAGAWRLQDLGSKNGCFVEGIAVRDNPLPPDCWLRFGDVHCQLQQFDSAQATQLRAREQQRHNLSAVMTRQIAGQTQFDSLLDEVLRGVVDLAGCSRGFLLLAEGDDYLVSASLVIDPKALDRRSFSGSVGAVQRVLSQGKPVVVNQVGREAWLAERASIVASDLPIAFADSRSRLASSRLAISLSAVISRTKGSSFSVFHMGRVNSSIEENMSGRFVPSGIASRCM